MEAFNQIRKWIRDGKLKFKETVFSGFGSMPHAFVELMNGNTTGKVVVKA